MEFEKTKLIELKEKFDSIINTEEKENVEFCMLEIFRPNLVIKDGKILLK